MKKIIIAVVFAFGLTFSGCSMYDAGKKVYHVGEVVVDVTENDSKTLAKIHKVAKSVDEAREEIKK